MKKFLYILLLSPILLMSQSQDQNYLKTKIYKVPSTASISSPSTTEARIDLIYFDGQGRPIQNRSHKQSNTGKDLVTHIEYDAFGREDKKYLPFVDNTTTLNYDSDGLNSVLNFYSTPIAYPNGGYSEATSYPYSEQELEAAPLNRVIKKAEPGDSWRMGGGHEIKVDYLTNQSQEVRLFKVNAIWDANSLCYQPSLQNLGYYATGQLHKTVIKNENWVSSNDNTTVEFKDKEGSLVLKRTFLNNAPIDSYYIYDQFGNLSYVLSPNVDLSQNLSSTVLDNLCYQYKYDDRNRLVEQKLPGKQWEFMIYDKLDRLVANGPAASPFPDLSQTGWLITKYDIYSRIAYSAWMPSTVNSSQRKILQSQRNTEATNFNETKIATTSNTTINNISFRYTNVAWPTSGFHILTVNYYDDYNFPNAPSIPASIEGEEVYYNNTRKPKGLPTSSWTRILDYSNSNSGNLTYLFYDKKSRPIQVRTNNYFGGYTQVDSKIDFVGKINYSITRHKRTNSDNEIYIKEDFTYSDQDRLIKHTHQIGASGIPQLISKNEYDELGKLAQKSVGNSENSPLQEIDYLYNIRDWLVSINSIDNLEDQSGPDDLFAMKLSYDTPATAQPLYNKNVSEIYWRTANGYKLRKYSLSYDNLHRLVSAVYEKPDESYPITNSYDEYIDYDKIGNIIYLSRFGGIDGSSNDAIQIDKLDYYYDYNRLKKVTDNTNDPQGFKDDQENSDDSNYYDYDYDANGNLIKDKNKKIDQISYNHLNMPTKIIFADTSQYIEYVYDSNGTKVSKRVASGGQEKQIDYLGIFQYLKTEQSDAELQFFATAGGYVNVDGNYNNYVFNYTDHLGNIRLSYAQDPGSGNTKVIEENNYYLFGLKHQGYNSDLVPLGSDEAQKYKFQGQELQDELELGWYSFKWRNYDPALGRFMSIDPLTEKYNWMTPYQFASNQVGHAPELEGLENYDDLADEDRDFISFPLWGADLTGTDGSQIRTPEFDLDEVTIVSGGGVGDFDVEDMEDFSESMEFDEVEIDRDVVRAMAIPLIISQIDSPAPGPADVVALAVAVVILNYYYGPSISTIGLYDGMSQGSGQGRGTNNRQPDPEATGDHTVINERGSTTYTKNERNPTGWQEKKRVDTRGGSHRSRDGRRVPTPHVHEGGDVRPAIPGEDMPR